jgi:chromosome segregation ATPase
MASDDRVIIGVETTGTADASQQLGDVAAKVRDVGGASLDSAQGAEAFAAGVDSVVESITSSNTATEEQVSLLQTVRGELEQQRGAYEGNTQSLATVDAAIAKVNGALEKLGTAATSSSATIKTGIQSIDAPMETLRARLEDVQKKFAEGGRVTPADLAKIRVAQKAVTDAVAATGKEVTELGPEFKRALDTADREVEDARKRFINFNEEVQKQQRTLNDLEVSWRGFKTEAIEALGPTGVSIGKVTLAFTVFLEVFNKVIDAQRAAGVDMQAYDQALAGWKVSIGEVAAAITKLTTGDLEGFRQGLATADAALVLTQKELAGFKLAFDLGLESMEGGVKTFDEIKAKTAEYNDVQRLHNLAIQAGKDGLDALNKARSDSGGNLETWIGIMKAAEPALNDHIQLLKDTADAHKKIADEAGREIEARNKLNEQLSELTGKRDKDKAAMQAASDAQDSAAASVLGYRDAVAAQSQAVRQAEEAHRDAASEVEALKETHSAGSPVLQAAIDKEKALADQVGATKDRLHEAKDKLKESETAFTNAGKEVESYKGKVSDADTKIGDLGKKIGELTPKFETQEHWVKEAAKAIGEGKDSLAAVYLKLAESQPAVDASIEKITLKIKAQRLEVEGLEQAYIRTMARMKEINEINFGNPTTPATAGPGRNLQEPV